jgi:hypothetical protein
MRESRMYGSVRGACDETHVPTATKICCNANFASWQILLQKSPIGRQLRLGTELEPWLPLALVKR